jgi:hypothetical protein
MVRFPIQPGDQPDPASIMLIVKVVQTNTGHRGHVHKKHGKLAKTGGKHNVKSLLMVKKVDARTIAVIL